MALALMARRLVASGAEPTVLSARTAAADVLAREGVALTFVTASVGARRHVARGKLSEVHARIAAERGEGESDDDQRKPRTHERLDSAGPRDSSNSQLSAFMSMGFSSWRFLTVARKVRACCV